MLDHARNNLKGHLRSRSTPRRMRIISRVVQPPGSGVVPGAGANPGSMTLTSTDRYTGLSVPILSMMRSMIVLQLEAHPPHSRLHDCQW